MFLFIFESIGTSELLLVGIIALIFLGPRKLPEIARKIGKMMAEFRVTTNEFKETWQREVNFEEEAKALDLNNLEAEPVAREVTAGAQSQHEDRHHHRCGIDRVAEDVAEDADPDDLVDQSAEAGAEKKKVEHVRRKARRRT